MSVMRALTIATSALAGVTGLLVAAPADADVVDSGTESESFAFTDTNFCDAGLTVRVEGPIETSWRGVPHGPDGIVYYVAQSTSRSRLTNVETGAFVNETVRTTERDQTITVEDDSLLIEVLATGSDITFDDSGKLISANPGQIRFQLRVPDNGTPTDPSDDGEAVFVGVTRESTGRTDDFCATVLPALAS
jgi:hypothetical protein